MQQAMNSALIQKHQAEQSRVRHSMLLNQSQQWQQDQNMMPQQGMYAMPQQQRSTPSLMNQSMYAMPMQQRSTPSLMQQGMYAMPQQQQSRASFMPKENFDYQQQLQLQQMQQMQRPASMHFNQTATTPPLTPYGQGDQRLSMYSQIPQAQQPSKQELQAMQEYVKRNPTPYGASAVSQQQSNNGMDRRQSMMSMRSFSAGSVPLRHGSAGLYNQQQMQGPPYS